MWNDASGVGWGAGMFPVVWRGSWNDVSGVGWGAEMMTVVWVGELECRKGIRQGWALRSFLFSTFRSFPF